MKRLTLILLSIVVLSGCYKSELIHATYSDYGEVIISIIHPTIDDSEALPGSYTVVVDGREIITDGSDALTLTSELEPGEYYVYVYNNAAGVTVEQCVDTDGTIIITADSEGGVLQSLPEHIYFGVEKITVLADVVTVTQVSMAQISVDVYFNLHIAEGDPDRIQSISASLGGVAAQWECVSDVVWGAAASINPLFSRSASLLDSSSAEEYLTAAIRVLGTLGGEQSFAITLTYDDDTTQTVVSDITSQLTSANTDKSSAIILSGELNTPIESDQEGSITNWEQGSGGSHTVN